MAFEIRSFDLRDVKGLSQTALNLHLDLYHGYVEQVNTLLEVLQPLSRHHGHRPLRAKRRCAVFRSSTTAWCCMSSSSSS